MAKPNPVQMQKYLKGLDYPANKDEIVECARDNGANQETCDTLEHLPDKSFDSPTDVSRAIGEMDRGGSSH